jgi:hypothetical protein
MLKREQDEARQKEEAIRARAAAEQTRLFNKSSETITLYDVDRMSSDEYKRRLTTDKAFRDKVDELEAANIAAHPRQTF